MESDPLFNTVSTLEEGVERVEKSDRLKVTLPSARLISFLKKLKIQPELLLDLLFAHTAVDWKEKGEFELLYWLQSTALNHSLIVSVKIPRENSVIPSVSQIWKIAEWQEREVYDLFGILYEGHPDLRRLFLEDDWKGFPLRKDYQDDFILERPVQEKSQ